MLATEKRDQKCLCVMSDATVKSFVSKVIICNCFIKPTKNLKSEWRVGYNHT